MDTDEIHQEVEDMLEGSQAEILELIATDPEYYLNIVENYKTTRSGREIYLQDLFNILVRRDGQGKRQIKFKISDNARWVEVGYNGEGFTDEDVYELFQEKVSQELKRSNIYEPYLPVGFTPDGDNEKEEEKVENSLVVNKGLPCPQYNVNSVSKKDLFMGKTGDKKDLPEIITNVEEEISRPVPTVPVERPVLAQSRFSRNIQDIVESTNQDIVELFNLANQVDFPRREFIYYILMNRVKND